MCCQCAEYAEVRWSKEQHTTGCAVIGEYVPMMENTLALETPSININKRLIGDVFLC